jgi:hypothetical protein
MGFRVSPRPGAPLALICQSQFFRKNDQTPSPQFLPLRNCSLIGEAFQDVFIVQFTFRCYCDLRSVAFRTPDFFPAILMARTLDRVTASTGVLSPARRLSDGNPFRSFWRFFHPAKERFAIVGSSVDSYFFQQEVRKREEKDRRGLERRGL